MTNYPINCGRRSIRLKGYDYSQAGAYFITICTQKRECLFGEISDRKMVLNHAGNMIQTVWDTLRVRFTNAELDEFVVMPNHIHGIVVLTHTRTRTGDPCVRPEITGDHTPGKYPIQGDHKDRPYGYGTLPDTIGRIFQAFKSITTHEYTTGVKQLGWQSFPGRLWQRNYWGHIIRDEMELNWIREYIRTNPFQWDYDRLNQRDSGPVCPNMVQEPGVIYGTERWMV